LLICVTLFASDRLPQLRDVNHRSLRRVGDSAIGISNWLYSLVSACHLGRLSTGGGDVHCCGSIPSVHSGDGSCIFHPPVSVNTAYWWLDGIVSSATLPCPIDFCSMRYSGPNRCQLFVDHCAPTMEHNQDHSSRSLLIFSVPHLSSTTFLWFTSWWESHWMVSTTWRGVSIVTTNLN